MWLPNARRSDLPKLFQLLRQVFDVETLHTAISQPCRLVESPAGKVDVVVARQVDVPTPVAENIQDHPVATGDMYLPESAEKFSRWR